MWWKLGINSGSGSDLIYDYDAAVDTKIIDTSFFQGSQVGDDVVLSLSGGRTITLVDYDIANNAELIDLLTSITFV